jgi:hypothetical protein
MRLMVAMRMSRMLSLPTKGVSKRQRTAALQDLAEEVGVTVTTAS